MSRPWIATLGGIVFFVAYLVAATTLGGSLAHASWAVQLLYYGVAGVAWFPVIRWIMLWSVYRR